MQLRVCVSATSLRKIHDIITDSEIGDKLRVPQSPGHEY